MSRYRKYTPEMVEMILNEPIAIVAERLGVRVSTLKARKSELRRKRGLSERAGTPHHNLHSAPAPSARANFARPAWFVEDLSAMTKGAL